jgi:hypothetical protein
MDTRRALFSFTIAAALLGSLPLIAAHGDDHMNMDAMAPIDGDYPAVDAHKMESYFRHGEYGVWNWAHAAGMILAWVFLMPLAIMLSVARSRFHLPAQALFHAVNGLGLFAGLVYNRSTPDLYEHNAHHPLGWVVITFTIAWTFISLYVAYGEHRRIKSEASEESKATHIQQSIGTLRGSPYESLPRESDDSGYRTDRNSASLFGSRQNSSDEMYQKAEAPMDDLDLDGHDRDDESERHGFMGTGKTDRLFAKSIGRMSNTRAENVARFCQIVLEKLLLLLGFAAIASGFIVSGGLFRDRQIFSGMAHYVKGGIFFWYGLLTLGRWMGAFTEFGWAWNVRPQRPLVSKWKSMVPSAEFTESFVIWLYGATNVFLEHLNNWGSAWSASDIEHVSITALFFGGGLLGMLVECEWVRNLLNTPVIVQKSKDEKTADAFHYAVSGPAEEQDRIWEQPSTYRTPLNPMPALTIMLLGMMMGAHHQTSMVSTMMHAQWGSLFTAFALARGATYILMYLKPPTSHYPSRPPTEIVAAFCLTAGGILFMNSAADVVWAIESNGLDAMTVFTVTMGLTGIILAWEVVVFAIKGWAVRKESAASGRPLR